MAVTRTIQFAMQQSADKYPILVLSGPRQSGKTTLLKAMFPNYRYVNLENPDMRYFAENDPKGFLKEYDKQVIFDEVQRVPALLSYLQPLVDESGRMGQFILSGSQNFQLRHTLPKSLDGSVAYFSLFPLDHAELCSAGWLNQEDYAFNMLRGFYPAIYDRAIPSKTFYANYVKTYIQKDISDLYPIRDLRLFRNFLGLCATHAGQALNLNAMAKACGISQPTAKSWLTVLETSYLVFQLHPYQKKFGKRIVKTPKLYFYDSGLLCYLLKINTKEQLQTHHSKPDFLRI